MRLDFRLAEEPSKAAPVHSVRRRDAIELIFADRAALLQHLRQHEAPQVLRLSLRNRAQQLPDAHEPLLYLVKYRQSLSNV
jgi:hypothetical protein